MLSPARLPPRLQAAIDKARAGQFASDEKAAARSARAFNRLRQTKAFRAYPAQCREEQETRDSARLWA